jgi:6-phosphogluconolactonase (cycloisomerase 2 family)
MHSHAIPFKIACALLYRHALRWVALSFLLLSIVAPALADAFPTFAYVPIKAENRVKYYEVQGNGLLIFRGTAATGKGPVRVIPHPTLPVLYVLNADSFNISVFQMDRASGALQLRQTKDASGDPVAGVIDGSGRFLCVTIHIQRLSGPGAANGLLKYEIIPPNGDLMFKEFIPAGGTAPSAVARDPKQPFFSVTNQFSNNLARLRMDPAGQLRLIQVAPTGIYPVAVRNHPSEPYLIVANLSSRNLSIFSINADGKVTLTGIATADYGPSSLAFAPDGRHLYVTNSISYTLVTYSVLNGRLTRQGATATGHDPEDVTLSTDGRFLYTAEALSGAVGVHQIGANDALPRRIATVKTGYLTKSVTIVTPH